MNPGFPPFDPSKMDPKLIAELTDLLRQLPPNKIMQMQTLMHNMMAGHNVQKEMEEFEKSLPPGFRERLMGIYARFGMGPFPTGTAGPAVSQPQMAEPEVVTSDEASSEMSVREARLTILRGVSQGDVSPEQALELLFPDSRG